jgi:hypothetical protein
VFGPSKQGRERQTARKCEPAGRPLDCSGGYPGETMERSALKRLLEDVEANQ